MSTRKWLDLAALAVLCLLLSGCAAGPNPTVGATDAHGLVAGFWRGAWHGLISPVALVVSWFVDSVSIYEVHNNGAWYNVGFMIGISMLGGGGGQATRRARRRRGPPSGSV